jgi:hypothetical protein
MTGLNHKKRLKRQQNYVLQFFFQTRYWNKMKNDKCVEIEKTNVLVR